VLLSSSTTAVARDSAGFLYGSLVNVIFRIDPRTGAATFLTTLGSFGSTDIRGLTSDPISGDLFAAAYNGPNSAKIYRISHTNWTYTLLTSNGFLNYPQGLTLDSAANRLLVVDPLSTVNGAVIAVDLGTGTQTVFSVLSPATGIYPSDIAVTASGDIWVGSQSGSLAHLSRTDGSVLGYLDPHMGQVNGVYAAPDGSLTVSGFVTGVVGQVESVNVTTGAVTVISSGGSLAFPNRTVTLGNGDVYVADSNDLIRLTANAARNVISGNVSYGVDITDSGTSSNIVEGNYIGTNSTGNAAVGNLLGGVFVTDSASLNTIGSVFGGADGNVISGNSDAGVTLNGPSNFVQGNKIGLSADGSAALGNSIGVYVYSANNTIGGAGTGAAGNVIAGNSGDDLILNGASATGNVVANNLIGTNGATVFPNGGYGLELANGAQATVSGAVTGDILNSGDLILPGAGVLAVTGNYTQTAAGSLTVNIGGANAGTFDQLQVSGVANLDGTLNVNEINSFMPVSGQSFPVLTFGSSSGDFAAFNGLALGTGASLNPALNATNLTLALSTVVNTPPTVSAGGNVFATVGVAFTQYGSFTDPDMGDSWTATVDYGDGAGSHPLTLNGDKAFLLSNVYASPGAYIATVTVNDGNTGIGSASFAVFVAPPAVDNNNDAPGGASAVTITLPSDASGTLDFSQVNVPLTVVV
jgi:PKD domain